MEYTIQCGTQLIPYTLIYTKRKTIAIYVYKNGTVSVRSPRTISIDRIQQFVESRSAWIAKKMVQYEQYTDVLENKCVYHGDKCMYLGKAYTVDIVESRYNSCAIEEDRFVIHTKKMEIHSVQKQLELWYKSQAKSVLYTTFLDCKKRFFATQYSSGIVEKKCVSTIKPLQFCVRKMKRRWGSLSRSGKLTLNEALIKAPLACIEYVLFHELCHTVEFNHSIHFYRLLEYYIPDYKEIKKRLEATALL